MMPAFSWPARHAPGYPPGCVDSGDVLAHFARADQRQATVVVVTSALRASVEDSGDHEAGLERVRHSLNATGRNFGAEWNPSYYGKDLVLIRAGKHSPPVSVFTDLLGAEPAGDGVRHGWALDYISLAGDSDARRERLLRACYGISMAARMRRDWPDLQPFRADDVLGQVPRLLSVRQSASLLAGVLVRPLGSRETGLGAGPEEDPRFPGLQSADAWEAFSAAPPQRGIYVVSDVHDIEWGTPCRRRCGVRLTEGNAHQMLPLATMWLNGSLPLEDVLRRAYQLRVHRESLLLGHLRTMSDAAAAGGALFATLGDGLSGIVSDTALLRTAVTTANDWTDGQMHSGAGLARLGEAGLGTARRHAHFSLHVTKTLKGTPHRERILHVFGEPLSVDAADSVVAFLSGLWKAGPGTPGFHHLAHALRWRGWWQMHLPSSAHARLALIFDSGHDSSAADT